MPLLSIKTAIYYMFCLLLSTLGIIEFDEVWNPSPAAKDHRVENTEAYTALKMAPRKVDFIAPGDNFAPKKIRIDEIPGRTQFSKNFNCLPAFSCRYLVVLDEPLKESEVKTKMLENEYVFIISN